MCNGGQMYLWINYKLKGVPGAKRKLKPFLYMLPGEKKATLRE